MGSLGRPLALGMELSSLIVLSYWFHEKVASILKIDAGLCLAILMGLSLSLWTVHAYFFFENKS